MLNYYWDFLLERGLLHNSYIINCSDSAFQLNFDFDRFFYFSELLKY